MCEPVAELPYAPCRLQPRDVILQDRWRLIDGERDESGRPRVEAYQKPRVTTNASHGGEDSVNAGVPHDQTKVALPGTRMLARACALCGEAGWLPSSHPRAWRGSPSQRAARRSRTRDGAREVQMAQARARCRR